MTDTKIALNYALDAAVKASGQIMQIYAEDFEPEFKQDGSPVTKADLASTAIIEKILEPLGVPLTGEESEKTAYAIRQNWSESWCVDPLDGTKEFVKRNGEFAVNIALIRDHQPVLGVIASPVNRLILAGGKEIGAFLIPFDQYKNPENWQKIEPEHNINQPLRVATSRSHHSGPVLQFLKELKVRFPEVEFIKKGSSLKFFDLVTGTADAYPRYAPTMEWDIAAGQAILEAVGGTVVHAETGIPLYYNKENLYNPYFVAKTAALLAAEK